MRDLVGRSPDKQDVKAHQGLLRQALAQQKFLSGSTHSLNLAGLDRFDPRLTQATFDFEKHESWSKTDRKSVV